MSVTGLDMWRTDPHPAGLTAHAVPGPTSPESLPALERLLRRGTIAAVIAEPIQGNGGIIVPPDDYWPELRRLCSRYGTLLIADEMQTAWNRTGRWFATQHWHVTPDIVTVAKALGNGFPIAAYITTDAIAALDTGLGPRRSAAIWCPAGRPWPRCASISATNWGSEAPLWGITCSSAWASCNSVMPQSRRFEGRG